MISLGVNKTLGYFRTYYQETFNWALYGYMALFLLGAITLNYTLGIDQFIEMSWGGSWGGVSGFFVLYAVAWYGMAIPMLAMLGKTEVYRDPEFWWKSAVLVGAMALRRGGFFHGAWAQSLNTNYDDYRYTYTVLLQFNKSLVTFLPLALLIWWDRKKVPGWYGLHFKKFDYRPYLMFVLVMAPLVIAASYTEGFQHSYPRYNPLEHEPAFGMSNLQMALGFEGAYGLNFVSLELLFRGAMVWGMVHILGKECLLPMVTLYAVIHFGKPLGECISSIFGGLVLGIFSLYSKSIWGGIFIHLGVAWGMELAAFLQG